MTRRRQKIEEKLYAECASALLCENWAIQEPDNEYEWPDLLVKTATESFGLEVRKLYSDEDTNGSKLREYESSNIRLLRQTATIYYGNEAPPVKVQFYGHPDNPSQIADKLAMIVPSMHTWEHKKVSRGYQQWMYVRRLPNECGQYCRWEVISDSVGWVSNIDQLVIQRAIQKKAANLAKYRKNIDDVRLLLVCDRRKNSGKYLFGNPGRLENAGFKHIYLLSFPDEIAQSPA